MWRFREALRGLWQQRTQRWLLRRHPRGAQAQRLTQNRVYIFLSRTGVLFVCVLAAMLLAAINYDLALGYLLVFMLMSMSIVSIFHTFRNLLGLTLLPGRVEGGFVGETARFEVLLENADRLPRRKLHVYYDEATATVDVAPADSTRVWLGLPAVRRGWLLVPRLRIETHWPIGVFRSWSYANFDQRALIYPQVEGDPPPLPMAGEGEGEGVRTPRGHDDFAGLRPFARGDSPRHIAWKAAVRDDGLPVKEFHGEAALSLWLDWAALPPGMDVETRLSRLAAWVLMAHDSGAAYGLTIPGREIAPGQGEAHRDVCLAALALYGERPAGSA